MEGTSPGVIRVLSSHGGLCGHACLMEDSILSSFGWEAPGTGWIKGVTNLATKSLGPSRKEPIEGQGTWGTSVQQGQERGKMGDSGSTAPYMNLSHYPADQQNQETVNLESWI